MMTSSLLFAETSASDILGTFGVSWPQLISQVTLFLIVFFVLKKFAFGPLLTVLEERKNKIAESLENSEKIKTELAQAEATRKDIIQKANDRANQLIAEAQKTAAVQGERKLQEATAEAESIVSKAKEAAQLEREKLLAEVKREAARLVVNTTGKVIGKVLTAEDQQRLNEEATRQLAA